ncbi:MAG: DUF445 family protein [Opitutales bacterium]|nr:DUF445 family protein [Opitutales bacterium]NRA25834.1 DUF445 family protein [Opitutales bacterium]
MTAKTIIIFSIPFITAFIGWLTNWVAIKMLFRPQRPQRVLGLVTWQGLIPRRQPELAAKAAEIIERELVSNHVIHDKIRGVDIKPGLRTAVSRLIRQRLVPKLQGIPLVGNFVNDQAVESLENMALEEIDKEGEVLMEKIATKFESNFDVKHIVEQRIQEFDLDRLESIVMEVARKEFKTIERLGFVLGFVVGCLQVALIWFTGGMG